MCDLLPWAWGDEKGKEICCNNRTDWFFMRVLLQMESELCARKLGSLSPSGEAAAPGGNGQETTQVVPFLNVTSKINNCSFTVFSDVWKSPESSLLWLSHASFTNQDGGSSRALDQTHLVQEFGAEKSACGVSTQIQALLWPHLTIVA